MRHAVEAKGTKIPSIGLGTMTLKDDVCIDAVSTAHQMGYRHIDTATFYGNEAEVGEGIRRSGIPREEIFLTTKVRHKDLAPGDFETAVKNSLDQLALPYVDLLLIHWPSPTVPLSAYIPLLCQAKRNGQTTNIGVANFTIALLDQAESIADEPLINNQIEVHPFLDQSAILADCERRGIAVTAYCPLGRGRIPGHPVLDRIAKAYDKTEAQVALRWLTQQGLAAIPRTATPEKLKLNIDIFDFKLSEAEMTEIGTLAEPNGRLVNPPQAPQWDV